MSALIASLLFLLAAFRVQAEPTTDMCLHPEWNIPKGTYIEKFCPDQETRAECLRDVINYEETAGLLFVDFEREGYQYSLEIINPCSYVEAGFDIYPVIANYEETPELWVYAEGATNRKRLTIDNKKNNLKDPFLNRLTTKGLIGNSCELRYYPDQDFLVGKCESQLKKNIFVMIRHFKERAAEIVQSEMGSLSSSTTDHYAIANLDGQVRLQYCPDEKGTRCYTKDAAYVTKMPETCPERETTAVKINGRWFCHDRTIDKEYIKIADCEIENLAVDSTEGLLIAECTSGHIRYLPNPAACIEAGLEFSRVKDKGHLLGCELSKSKGTAVVPDHQAESTHNKNSSGGSARDEL